MTAATPPLRAPLTMRVSGLAAFAPGLLPMTVFTAIIAWALYAVLMLTGTITAANQIDDRVGIINTVYPTINQNLKAVALAADTGRIAGQIRDAAAPLSPQFTQIIHDVGGINTSVDSILGDVKTINTSVLSINNAVHTIHGSVLPIAAGLDSVDHKARSINNSVHQINDRFGRIRDHVYSIDDRLVHGSNDRIQHVIDHAEGIQDDTDRLAHSLVPDILRNAHAISRSPLIDPTDTSRLDTRRLNPLLAGLTNPDQLPSLLGLVQAARKPAVPTLPGATINKPLGSLSLPKTAPELANTLTSNPLLPSLTGPGGPRGPQHHDTPPADNARSVLPLGGLLG
jgi:uncharacterized protein YoxC